jgi:hypothetical protein
MFTSDFWHPTRWTPRERIIFAFFTLWLISTLGLIVLGTHVNNNTNRTQHAFAISEKARDKSEATVKALRKQAIQSCKRGNERTVDENRSHLDDWLFFTKTIALIELSLALPQPPDPNITPAERAAAERRTLAYLNDLRGFASRKTWKHLVENCEASVDDPSAYKLPPPVRFSEHPIPPGALRIDPGE